MSAGPQIRLIPRAQLDTVKWDACMESADNSLIYGYSFYLDHMAPHWDGLVLNDYEAVMPLTWNRKFGISYLYQPFLTAQLGIFGKSLRAAQCEAFFDAIPSRFRYWDISLNSGNIFNSEKYPLYLRDNYTLHLQQPHEVLQAAYRENIRRNIRKAVQVGCRFEKGFAAEQVIELALNQMQQHTKESSANTDRFRKLFSYLQQRGMAITYGVYLNEDLLASCIFFLANGRAYYILVGNHPNGKTIGASHALIDAFIKDHAGKDMVLDFEGSDIRNLAFFYSSFGATEEKYAAIRMNRLPVWGRWLKR